MAKLNLEGIDDKELIQLVKMKIEKSKNVRDTNKAIVNNLKTQLNKTKLPKNINTLINIENLKHVTPLFHLQS